MDESHLKQMLEGFSAPAPDENAKKRALNLALAEFDAAQNELMKKSQGVSLLARLMGSSDKQQRRKPMRKTNKLYGGLAMTAVGLMLFCAPIVYQAMFNTVGSGLPAGSPPTLGRVMFNSNGGSNNFGAISSNVASSTVVLPLARWRSADSKSMEESARAASSTIPMPAAPSHMAIGGAVPAQMASMDSDATQNYYKDVGRDKFKDFEENPVKDVKAEPVSTFSIDVDTASYSFMRRMINSNVMPQKDAVRIEEMINYFPYNYEHPATKELPFQSTVTVTPSPWKEGNKLIHIGIKGYDIDKGAEQPHSNLVFLIDTSGSMSSTDKLQLVIQSMKLLLDQLRPDDTVGIVTYAGSAGVALEPTKVSDKSRILAALDRLQSGGSTAGAEGIRTAYQLAESNFEKGAVNRVILATDGDFNVGITNPQELKDFVERKRETGVFLSVLGFGQGNYNDNLMQELAQNGNGVAAYIDTLNEARKVLVDEATSSLFTIAKDVKIQVEFNPATVSEYRLVGYETRHLNREDFNNDKVDAGDIGAGHTVTAIYEITPVGAPRAVDESRYQKSAGAEGTTKCIGGRSGTKCAGAVQETQETKADTNFADEYAFLKIRYKQPDSNTSQLITTPITSGVNRDLNCPPCPVGSEGVCAPCPVASDDVRFSIAVAAFGELLKGGKYSGGMTYDDVINMAQAAKGADEFGYRAEFINLVRLAKSAAAIQNTQQPR